MSSAQKQFHCVEPDPNKQYPLYLGSSFFPSEDDRNLFLTLRYRFKPTSVDQSKDGSIRFNKKEAIVKFPCKNDDRELVFRGQAVSAGQQDFLVWFDAANERMILERISVLVKSLNPDRNADKTNQERLSKMNTTSYRTKDRLRKLGQPHKPKSTRNKASAAAATNEAGGIAPNAGGTTTAATTTNRNRKSSSPPIPTTSTSISSSCSPAAGAGRRPHSPTHRRQAPAAVRRRTPPTSMHVDTTNGFSSDEEPLMHSSRPNRPGNAPRHVSAMPVRPKPTVKHQHGPFSDSDEDGWDGSESGGGDAMRNNFPPYHSYQAPPSSGASIAAPPPPMIPPASIPTPKANNSYGTAAAAAPPPALAFKEEAMPNDTIHTLAAPAPLQIKQERLRVKKPVPLNYDGPVTLNGSPLMSEAGTSEDDFPDDDLFG